MIHSTPLWTRRRVLISAAVATVCFLWLLIEVVRGNMQVIDIATLLAVRQTASPEADTLFLAITRLGDYLAATGVAVGLAVIYACRNLVRRGAYIACGTAGAISISTAMKLLIERQRPDLWEQLITPTTHSFPSGHAMGSSALAMSLAVASWHTRWRWPVCIIGCLYVLAVGYSRLYLGVHYLSDIVGGWLASSVWMLALWLAMQSTTKHSSRR